MAYRKKTLRRMSPKARQYAKLVTDLESVTRRLKNYLPTVQELELWARAAQAEKRQGDKQHLEKRVIAGEWPEKLK